MTFIDVSILDGELFSYVPELLHLSVVMVVIVIFNTW